MGSADYLSKHPTGKATKVSKYDENFVIALLKRVKKNMGINKPPKRNAEKEQQVNETRSERTKKHMTHPTRKAKLRNAKPEFQLKTQNRFNGSDSDSELLTQTAYEEPKLSATDARKIKMLSEDEQEINSAQQSRVGSFMTAVGDKPPTQMEQREASPQAQNKTVIPGNTADPGSETATLKALLAAIRAEKPCQKDVETETGGNELIPQIFDRDRGK